jgi:cytochrome c553
MHRLLTLVLISCAILLGVARAAWSADPAPSGPPDTMEQRMLACAACHGTHGEGLRSSEYYPRIAGKPAAYLYSQLVSFREGRRKYPQMVYLVRHQSDAYLREIAEYYARQQPAFPPPAPAATKEAMALGASLVRRGDKRRGIPACIACHGADLAGMQPGIPGIVGLYPDYVNTQLGAWQRGLRRATEPDCMAQVVAKLNGTEIAAISAWLAAQPASPKAAPAPEARQKLPLACGTEPQ